MTRGKIDKLQKESVPQDMYMNTGNIEGTSTVKKIDHKFSGSIKPAGVEENTIHTTKNIFVSALETIEDDETTETGNINIPEMNLLKLPGKTKKEDHDTYSNCTELLSNVTIKEKVITMDKASDIEQKHIDVYMPTPGWTNIDWEGSLTEDTIDTVVVTPSKTVQHDTGRDWKSPCLGNMYGLFSHSSQKTDG